MSPSRAWRRRRGPRPPWPRATASRRRVIRWKSSDAAPRAAAGDGPAVHLSTKGERHGRNDDGDDTAADQAGAAGARLRAHDIRAVEGRLRKVQPAGSNRQQAVDVAVLLS